MLLKKSQILLLGCRQGSNGGHARGHGRNRYRQNCGGYIYRKQPIGAHHLTKNGTTTLNHPTDMP